MTADELAAKAGIHRNTLYRYEKGEETARSKLDERMFVKLCLHLNMDVAEVFAAASVAKIESELLPLQAEMRGEMGLPAGEVSILGAHQQRALDTIAATLSANGTELVRSALEGIASFASNVEMLLRLSPRSLLAAAPQEKARKKKTSKPAGEDTVKRGKRKEP